MSNRPKHSSKRTIRRVCLGGIAVTGGAALLVTSLPAFAQDDNGPTTHNAPCEVETLPGSTGTDQARILATDQTGTHFGGATYDDGRFKLAAVWQDGEITELTFDAEEEVNESQVNDVNADGDAAGYVYFDGIDIGNAFAYIDGETTQLPMPDDYYAKANAINDSGVIIGEITHLDTRIDTPVVWESPDAEPTPLPIPDDAVHGFASDIDNDGRIVGTHAERDRKDSTPYLWDADGNGQALQGATRARANNIDGDWISGSIPTQNNPKAPARWSAADAEPEEIDISYILDINAKGDAVGSNGSGINLRAAKYTADNKLYMLPFPGEATISDAHAVSGDGLTIAGWVVAEDAADQYDYRAAIWNCEE